MNEHPEHFQILRKIDKKPNSTQRELANDLGISLGKLNYCITALKKKGLIKIQNFKKNPKKINYLYILTPRGIAMKTNMTIDFMKKKIQEYNELKSELNNKS
jgi:EPS-associated MarR family transcriptional regulator